MSEAAGIRVDREEELAWLTIDRPAAHNALNLSVWRELTRRIEEIGSDRSVRVVLLRGAGEKAFIAGADITEFGEMRSNTALAEEYDRISERAWAAIERIPQPVLAVIRGICFGGGVSIALSCDLRIGSEDARFAVPAMRLGLSYPPAAIARMRGVLGHATATALLVGGCEIGAPEALTSGLLHRLEPAANLEAAARRWAKRIAAGAPLTLGTHKAILNELARSDRLADPAEMRRLASRCFETGDYAEGIAAFLGKRDPVFRGE